jgi:phage terminase large subunit-like protein
VVRASLSDRQGDALFIGTPKGRNHFYDLFHMEDSHWKSWHFTTADNPLIPPEEIAAAKRSMSTFSFRQEFQASFDNSGTDIFREEWLKYGVAPKQYSTYIAVDLAGFEAVSKKNSRLDRTAIAVVFVTDEGKWFVRKIEYGRWDIKETAVRILKAIRDFKPLMVGIERGITMNAVMPYLSDLMRKHNIFAHIHPLTHGNQSKNDRIIWALQGLFEHGRVTLNRDIEWDTFIDEYLMFPTANVHDDLLDATSMIAQMAVTNYVGDSIDDSEENQDIEITVGF